MEIEIRNWEKYNPKRAQRTYTWLRLDNDIARGPEFYGLSNEEKFVAILLLCEASKKGKGRFWLAMKWFCDEVAKVSLDFLTALLKKLSTPNDQGECFILVHKGQENEVDASSLQHTTPVLQSTTPTYERTDVRTDVRTDGFNLNTAFTKTFVVDLKSQHDLDSDEISSKLSNIAKLIGPTKKTNRGPNLNEPEGTNEEIA